jgi:hypothetical protein
VSAELDRTLEIIERGLATAETTEPAYGTDIGSHVCWRCQVNAPGEGASGVCEGCRETLLDETKEPEPSITDGVWTAVGEAPIWGSTSRYFRRGVARVYVSREGIQGDIQGRRADLDDPSVALHHIDGNPANNTPENLEAVLPRENRLLASRDQIEACAEIVAREMGVSAEAAREQLQRVFNAYAD